MLSIIIIQEKLNNQHCQDLLKNFRLKVITIKNSLFDKIRQSDYIIILDMSIKSIEELILYFKNYERPLFYIGPMYGTTMFNIHDFFPKFEMLMCNDPYNGILSFIKVPQKFKTNHKCSGGQSCQNEILSDPSVIDYMKKKDPQPNVIYLLVNIQSQRLCQQNGLNYLGVSETLFSYLGNKVKIIDLLHKAQIPFIPNIISQIKSYEHFLEITSSFGTSNFVVQQQMGASGIGTSFISDEADYRKHQADFQNGNDFKIMPFRNIKCFAVDAVATKSGTIMGPLVGSLIGHKQLTVYRGGYCGNQIRKSYFEDQDTQMKVRRQIFHYTQKLGDFLYKQVSYRGIFGFDFAVDMDTNEVFFIEINPRLTGTTRLTYQYYQAQGIKFPLFLFHVLQFEGVSIQFDIQQLNKRWLQLKSYEEEVSQIIFKTSEGAADMNIPYKSSPGFWKIENDALEYTGNNNFRIGSMKDDEIFFIQCKGYFKGNIILKKRCQDYNFQLTNQAKDLISKFTVLMNNNVEK